MKKVRIVYDSESIGDQNPAAYAGMLEALIAEHFGGQYEYDIRPGVGNRVELHGSFSDGEEYDRAKAAIRGLMEEAFRRLCDGVAAPDV